MQVQAKFEDSYMRHSPVGFIQPDNNACHSLQTTKSTSHINHDIIGSVTCIDYLYGQCILLDLFLCIIIHSIRSREPLLKESFQQWPSLLMSRCQDDAHLRMTNDLAKSTSEVTEFLAPKNIS